MPSSRNDRGDGSADEDRTSTGLSKIILISRQKNGSPPGNCLSTGKSDGSANMRVMGRAPHAERLHSGCPSRGGPCCPRHHSRSAPWSATGKKRLKVATPTLPQLPSDVKENHPKTQTRQPFAATECSAWPGPERPVGPVVNRCQHRGKTSIWFVSRNNAAGSFLTLPWMVGRSRTTSFQPRPSSQPSLSQLINSQEKPCRWGKISGAWP